MCQLGTRATQLETGFAITPRNGAGLAYLKVFTIQIVRLQDFGQPVGSLPLIGPLAGSDRLFLGVDSGHDEQIGSAGTRYVEHSLCLHITHPVFSTHGSPVAAGLEGGPTFVPQLGIRNRIPDQIPT